MAPFVNKCVSKCVTGGVNNICTHVFTTVIRQVSLKVSHYQSKTMMPSTICIPNFFNKSLS